jgi:dethiobiotin synthetase
MNDLNRPQVRFRIPGLFFTGTDTGVGKTFVTAAVVRQLRADGRSVRVCKPVATGANGHRFSADTARLAEAAGVPRERWPQVTPWTFADAVAPSVAARRYGVSLTLGELVDAVRVQSEVGSTLLVEGVGGLLCPLTETETVADLIAALGMSVVVVARRSLGTLNHTLLTLEVARRRKLPVAGVVVSETAPPTGLAEETNVDELRRWIDVPLLAVVSYQQGLTPEMPAALAGVDWWQLSTTMSAERGSA